MENTYIDRYSPVQDVVDSAQCEEQLARQDAHSHNMNHTGAHKWSQGCAQVLTGMHRYLQACTLTYRHGQLHTGTDSYKQARTVTFRRSQSKIDGHTVTHRCIQLQIRMPLCACQCLGLLACNCAHLDLIVSTATFRRTQL